MAETNGESQIVKEVKALIKEIDEDGLHHAQRSKQHVSWISVIQLLFLALPNLVLFMVNSSPLRFISLGVFIFIVVLSVKIWHKRSWWDEKIEWWEDRVNG